MNIATPKILLSYAHVDLGYAKKIYDDLKRYSLDVWLDVETLFTGNELVNRVYGLSRLGKWINILKTVIN